MMNIGDKAPEILGKDEQGCDIRLSDYRGRKLVLYFYPKDNTSGCTSEACSLRDHYDENVQMVGKAVQSKESGTTGYDARLLDGDALDNVFLAKVSFYLNRRRRRSKHTESDATVVINLGGCQVVNIE